MQIREPGQTKYIYLGRGHGYEGFWLGSKQIKSALRKRDQFLEYLRRHLGGSVLNRVNIDEDDRIIQLVYRRMGQTCAFFFFYNGRELYFAHKYYDEKNLEPKLFRSWVKGVEDGVNEEFEIFNTIGRKKIERKESEKKVLSIEKLLKNEEEKALGMLSSGKSKKFLNRKIKNIKDDLETVNKWPVLEKYIAESEDLSKLDKKVKIEGFKFNFKDNEHYKRRDEIYTKIKKLKKAFKILELRKSDTIETLEKVENNQENFINNLKTIKPVWSIKASEKIENISNEKNYKVFSLKNIKIGIGLNTSGNDQLRKEWAKKTDMWFHLDGDKSPHIVCKNESGIFDEEIYQQIAAAIYHFGDIKKEELNFIFTHVKNVKGVKGRAGAVTFKKEKRISVQVNTKWSDIISNE